MQEGSHPPGKLLCAPDTLQAMFRITVQKCLGFKFVKALNSAGKPPDVGHGQIQTLCPGRWHNVRCVPSEEQATVSHRLSHKTSHACDALLSDRSNVRLPPVVASQSR